jgi:hypothetical protein
MVGENRVSLSHNDYTSGLEAICSAQYRTSVMWVLRENLIFSSLSAYSPVPRVTRNILKPASLDYNLHAT